MDKQKWTETRLGKAVEGLYKKTAMNRWQRRQRGKCGGIMEKQSNGGGKKKEKKEIGRVSL